jgi:hypothetical protein
MLFAKFSDGNAFLQSPFQYKTSKRTSRLPSSRPTRLTYKEECFIRQFFTKYKKITSKSLPISCLSAKKLNLNVFI